MHVSCVHLNVIKSTIVRPGTPLNGRIRYYIKTWNCRELLMGQDHSDSFERDSEKVSGQNRQNKIQHCKTDKVPSHNNNEQTTYTPCFIYNQTFVPGAYSIPTIQKRVLFLHYC